MSNQFINCPKCGTRNFLNDTICGVCKTKLNTSLKSTLKNNSNEPRKVNYFVLVLIACGIIFIYYNLFRKEKSNEATKVSYADSSFQPAVSSKTPKDVSTNIPSTKSELENSPETQLAIINDQTKTPKQLTISLFRQLISSINNIYQTRNEMEIANALVAAHNIITKNGESDSLLEFTSGFNAFSAELDNNLNLQIEESLALYIRSVYKI